MFRRLLAQTAFIRIWFDLALGLSKITYITTSSVTATKTSINENPPDHLRAASEPLPRFSRQFPRVFFASLMQSDTPET
jgi:hypothetical protein